MTLLAIEQGFNKDSGILYHPVGFEDHQKFESHLRNSEKSRMPYAIGLSYPKQAPICIYKSHVNGQMRNSSASNELLIGNTAYETLAKGISIAKKNTNFRGIVEINYERLNELYFIVFALWFVSVNHTYNLLSLGQYSKRSYQKDLEAFRHRLTKRKLHVTLSSIHKAGLKDLGIKLLRTNLPIGNVCLLEETMMDHCI